MAATRSLVFALSFTFIGVTNASAQGRRGAPPTATPRAGTIERVSGAGGEAVVYLPASYASDPARRFPVVYLITDRSLENLKLPQAADKLAVAPGFSDAIVVSSAAAAEDLVGMIDGRYRTMQARISRGLGGISLGGDAALRLGMKRPDVFSNLYLLSASLADATVAALDANAASLQRLYSIAINVGTGDAALATNRRLRDAMTRLKIPHYYEEFDGTLDTANDRVETRLLPFFSRYLLAPANPTSPAVQ